MKLSKKDYDKLYHKKNKQNRISRATQWRKDNPEKAKESRLKKKYGLTLTQWDLIFQLQNKCCAICKIQTSGKFDWATDHCHVTGKVRGILCKNCNTGIGLLKENILVLESAIKYLKGSMYDSY